MSFGRYLVVMGSSWIVAAAAVLGFNVLVDALGILPARVTIAGFNAWKPLREEYDWIAKRFEVWQRQPITIFMGSSRIKQTIDPGLLAGLAIAPAYNGALNGSADLREIGLYLRYYLKADENLRYVYIEAFPSALLAYSDPKLLRKVRIPDDIADYSSVFFSMNGLSSSIRTVSLNRGRKADATASGSFDNGFAPIPLLPHHFSVRNVFNFVLHTRVLHRDLFVSPDMVQAATQAIEECRPYQAECRFFLSPLHADVLATAHYLGLWPELEKMKRVLAGLAPTYDFTRYSHLIDERIGPVVYWPEAFHFSPALGELMTKKMAGLSMSGVPDNFGTVLDPKSIESNLAAWRGERDRWIARNPELMERLRRADENHRRGMSFKEVTDAEVAAGGW
jgi:hypothetical protein